LRLCKIKSTSVILLIASLIFPGFLPITTFAQQTNSQLSESIPENLQAKLRIIEEFVRQQMVKDKVPGLTIGFYKDDFTWVKGFGYADLENKIPAQADSAYRLASFTKSFVGTAIMQLVEKGKMNLDAEIQTYLPYYPKQKWPVTVRQLLAHMGGGQCCSGLGAEYLTTRQVVERIAKNPIQWEPGTKFEYTTSGYNLLGAAIEEVSGKSFNDYLKENIWMPLGMKDTRIDSVTEMIPNRVRGYELVNGAIKNMRYIDVSTRFGGGGATGTVPDLLRWGKGIDSGQVLSKAFVDLMYSPVPNKNGYDAGLGDDYYTLGWVVNSYAGQFIVGHDGGQIGTNTNFIRIPSKNMTIAFACNLQEVDRTPYIRKLYEVLTDGLWNIRLYGKDKFDEAVLNGMGGTFDFGSLYFYRMKQPLSATAKDLAKAFAYFNKSVNRSALQAGFATHSKAINDGRHPVGDRAFITVGSFMAMKLMEKNGARQFNAYHRAGAIPFFADYIAMYKANSGYAKELKFNAEFENMIMKWTQGWAKTWNDYTQQIVITPESDFNTIGETLKKLFAGTEVRPNLIERLLAIQSGMPALSAGKLAVTLYPESARTNGNWGLFVMLVNQTPEGREALKKVSGEFEEALPYFKKSLELNPDGFASAKILTQIANSWVTQGNRLNDVITLLKIAVELHPQDAGVYSLLGEVYSKKDQKTEAMETLKKAIELDPANERAKELLKKLSQ
jgi:CubicO group peptidase (beta-lactamase class C family)/tetratricopeptide (TPR) repeat protein